MNQRMISGNFPPDVWAENWEALVKRESDCYKYCPFVRICDDRGQEKCEMWEE